MRIGKYEVVQELGAGGMGIVYKAIDPRPARTVAIKMIGSRADIQGTLHVKQARRSPMALDVDRRMMLVKEARLAGDLNHRNIVRVFDYGQHYGLLYIVMEYLEGRSLDRLIHVQPPLSLAQKVGIIAQLCDALAYAHSLGVIHRDVKPANTFVRTDGTVKVLDFGVAAKLAEVAREKGVLKGTINYVAPEMVLRHSSDSRVDIWAAGVAFYELMAGKTPFAVPSVTDTMFNIAHAPFPSLRREIAKVDEIERILGRALAKNPAQRYDSAATFARELRELEGQLGAADSASANVTGVNEGQTAQTTTYQQGFGLDIGLQETDNTVSVGTGVIAARRVIRRVRLIDFFSNIAFPSGVAIMFSLIILSVWGSGSDYLIGERVESYLVELILGMFVVTYLLVGRPKLALIPLAVLEALEALPRCLKCKSWMQHKSRWTRFALTDAAVSHGFSDCVAALKENLWEDAAKLLSLHGAESSPSITNTVVSPPIRYHLDFFDCPQCDDQCARVTTEDKDDEGWTTRAQYFQAYKASGSTRPSRSTVERWRHSIGAFHRALKAATRGLVLGETTQSVFRGLFIVLIALLLFLLAGRLLQVQLGHARKGHFVN